MRYEGTIYRPPSEAYSLIVQATVGCSHNKCTFCNMYKDKKFKIRKIEDIAEDLKMAREQYGRIKRVFLADGNALVMKTKDIKSILSTINELFPGCERTGIYATPADVLRKSQNELRDLKESGIGIIYLGLESGSSEILRSVKKGALPEDMINAAKAVKESGIKLSVTLISGLGGRKKWEEHALESARVLNAMDPDYLGLLTLLIEPGTELYEHVTQGRFELLNPKEIMIETAKLIENLELTNCIFRSNHASNYIALGGTLPSDKERLLKQLRIAADDEYSYKYDYLRRL